MGVGLEPVEAVLPLEVLDDRLGDVADVAAAQRAEAVDEDARLVEWRDDRQTELAPELEVLGPAAWGDVDDARALVLADLVPRHDPMLVRAAVGAAGGERRPDGRQLVERPLVAPADELAPGSLLEHLERSLRGPS